MPSKEVIDAYGRCVVLAMPMNMIVRSSSTWCSGSEGAAVATSGGYEVVMKGMKGGKEAFKGGFDFFGDVEVLDF